MRKIVLSVVMTVLLSTTSLAGDFGDAAQALDSRIEDLDSNFGSAVGDLNTSVDMLSSETAKNAEAIDQLNQSMGRLDSGLQQLQVWQDELLTQLNELRELIGQDPLPDPDPNPDPDPDPDPDPEPEVCLVSEVEPGQIPVISNLIPGQFEAEDFDIGGEGVAWHDTTSGNRTGLYRTDDTQPFPDIKATGDPNGGNYQIGWVAAGEWLEFTTCARTGAYDIWFRVSCGITSCGTITARLGDDELGVLQVEQTGVGNDGWDKQYATQVLSNVQVVGGNKILRLTFGVAPLDINWIRFVPTATNAGHILLDNTNVSENDPGAVIGNITVPGEECVQLMADDPRFEIVNGQLKLKEGIALDYEAEDLVSVMVTANVVTCEDL